MGPQGHLTRIAFPGRIETPDLGASGIPSSANKHAPLLRASTDRLPDSSDLYRMGAPPVLGAGCRRGLLCGALIDDAILVNWWLVNVAGANVPNWDLCEALYQEQTGDRARRGQGVREGIHQRRCGDGAR